MVLSYWNNKTTNAMKYLKIILLSFSLLFVCQTNAQKFSHWATNKTDGKLYIVSLSLKECTISIDMDLFNIEKYRYNEFRINKEAHSIEFRNYDTENKWWNYIVYDMAGIKINRKFLGTDKPKQLYIFDFSRSESKFEEIWETFVNDSSYYFGSKTIKVRHLNPNVQNTKIAICLNLMQMYVSGANKIYDIQKIEIGTNRTNGKKVVYGRMITNSNIDSAHDFYLYDNSFLVRSYTKSGEVAGDILYTDLYELDFDKLSNMVRGNLVNNTNQ